MISPTLATIPLLLPLSIGQVLSVPQGNTSLEATPPKTFGRLKAIHPHSTPGPLAVTRNGEWLLVAESCALAVVETEDPDSWRTARKLEPISSLGVRAVELALDPGALLSGVAPPSPESVLYVAGGRMGLWVVRADPRPGRPMPAARIDDAAEPSLATRQDSRRWCNDVEFIELGERSYLAALFAHKDDNRLRLYELDDARALVAGHDPPETGHELRPAAEVVITGNDAGAPEQRAFAYGLAVEGDTIYVATGMHGLVRVRFTDPLDPQLHELDDGPCFGDASHYARTIASGEFGGLYDDRRHLGLEPPQVLFQHPPYFLDVALEHDGARTYLWAAVDHLGLIRFDVSDPSAWSPALAIDHQEGGRADVGSDEGVRLVSTAQEPAQGMKTYAHRIDIVELDHDGDGHPELRALGAAVNPKHYFQSDGLLDEGRTVTHTGGIGQGVEVPWPGPGPGTNGPPLLYTLLYDLDAIQPNPPASPASTAAYNSLHALRKRGGHRVELGRGSAPGKVELFAGSGSNVGEQVQTTFRVRWDWPSGGSPEYVAREPKHRPGRNVYDIGFSPSNPETLLLGTNDAGVAADGILTLCEQGFQRKFYAPHGDGNDVRGSFGILFNSDAAWPGRPSGHDFLLGMGKVKPAPPNDPERPRWMLVDFDPGAGVCAQPPERVPGPVKRLFIESIPDRFGYPGRGWYIGGSVGLEYDEHLGTIDGPVNAMLFATMDGTPDGLVALDRLQLEELLLDPSVPAGALIDPVPGPDPIFLDRLDTHPEFAHLDPENHGSFLSDHGLLVELITQFPELLKLPSGGAERWALAVPSTSLRFPRALVPLVAPSERPDPVWTEHYDHSLVRVFDVHDPASLLDGDPATSPLAYTLIGRDSGSGTYGLEPVEWDGRDYLVVADLSGALQVWDVTDLFEPTTPLVLHPGLDAAVYDSFLIEEWAAPESVTDDLTNTLWSLAIDEVELGDEDAEPDAVHVYALVGRVGIEVLRFEPSAARGQRLVPIDHIETPFASGGLHIRELADGARDLLVGEARAGLRAFEYRR